MKPIHMLGALTAGVVAIVIANSAFVVNETEQAMVLQLGKVVKLEAEPGLKFRTPFIQQVLYFDKRILETDSQPEEFQSSGKKLFIVDSFTRWRITDAKKFYESVRSEYNARDRIDIIVNSNIRRELAQHTLVDTVSGDRRLIMDKIIAAAKTESEPLGIEIVDVRIKRTDLPLANSQKVYGRMKAEREKEAKEIRAGGAEEAQKLRADAERKRTIMLAEAQRDAQTLRGEGDAESIKVSAKAFSKDPEFYGFLRSLDAYKSSLKGNETLMVLDPSIDFFKHFAK